MLLTSLFDATLGANQPQGNRDLMVLAPTLERIRMEPDTVLTIDTIAMENGTERVDTSRVIEEKQVSNSNGPMSYRFIQDNMLDFEHASHSAYVNPGIHIDGYLEGRKYSFDAHYVSASYYDVFNFKFLYGGRFYEEDEEQGERVVILTDKAAEAYYGEVGPQLIGQSIQLANTNYTVRGIVARPLADSPYFEGDVYLPATTIDRRFLDQEEINGGFMAAYLAESSNQRALLLNEINYMAENYELPPDSYYNRTKLYAADFFSSYAMSLMQEENPGIAKALLFIPIIILLLLFAALPLLNLVNLNIGRVHERQSEIGVRKAFGANSSDILWQFIFENLVLTFIGGLAGLALAIGLINYVNANDLLGITRLSYSPRVFVYFFLLILVFGLLSGILPAYRISRSNIATALR